MLAVSPVLSKKALVNTNNGHKVTCQQQIQNNYLWITQSIFLCGTRPYFLIRLCFLDNFQLFSNLLMQQSIMFIKDNGKYSYDCFWQFLYCLTIILWSQASYIKLYKELKVLVVHSSIATPLHTTACVRRYVVLLSLSNYFGQVHTVRTEICRFSFKQIL